MIPCERVRGRLRGGADTTSPSSLALSSNTSASSSHLRLRLAETCSSAHFQSARSSSGSRHRPRNCAVLSALARTLIAPSAAEVRHHSRSDPQWWLPKTSGPIRACAVLLAAELQIHEFGDCVGSASLRDRHANRPRPLPAVSLTSNAASRWRQKSAHAANARIFRR
jgi:hypothetical protein